MDGIESGAAAAASGSIRRVRTKLERRQIVEETLQPGTSVSRVARKHDVNANQLFYWRKLYRAGLLEVDQQSSGTLVPIKVSDSIQKLRATGRVKSTATASGTIDIDLGHARVRIEGAADPDCIRAALEGLVR